MLAKYLLRSGVEYDRYPKNPKKQKAEIKQALAPLLLVLNDFGDVTYINAPERRCYTNGLSYSPQYLANLTQLYKAQRKPNFCSICPCT